MGVQYGSRTWRLIRYTTARQGQGRQGPLNTWPGPGFRLDLELAPARGFIQGKICRGRWPLRCLDTDIGTVSHPAPLFNKQRFRACWEVVEKCEFYC